MDKGINLCINRIIYSYITYIIVHLYYVQFIYAILLSSFLFIFLKNIVLTVTFEQMLKLKNIPLYNLTDLEKRNENIYGKKINVNNIVLT